MKKAKTLTLEELAELNNNLNLLRVQMIPELTLEPLTAKEIKAWRKTSKKLEKQIKGIETTLLIHLANSVKTESGIKALEETLRGFTAGRKTKGIGHYGVAKAYARLAIELSAMEQTRDSAQAQELVNKIAGTGMKRERVSGESVGDEKIQDFYSFACNTSDSRAKKAATQILQADGIVIAGPSKEKGE